jgi:hypothetical protein
MGNAPDPNAGKNARHVSATAAVPGRPSRSDRFALSNALYQQRQDPAGRASAARKLRREHERS